MFYLVFIWLNPGQAETLRAYERVAAPIMRAHGGELERIFLPAAADLPAGRPDEVHLLRFADPDGFERFRADPALQPAVPLREAAVLSVQLLALREQDLGEYLAEG